MKAYVVLSGNASFSISMLFLHVMFGFEWNQVLPLYLEDALHDDDLVFPDSPLPFVSFVSCAVLPPLIVPLARVYREAAQGLHRYRLHGSFRKKSVAPYSSYS